MDIDALVIRPADEADAEAIHQMICELAEFEKMLDQVESTPDTIRNSLFGDVPDAEAIVADWEGQPIAFALFFQNFSTFIGKPGLYLEDVYVRPSHRRKGVGKELLKHLAGIAQQRECGRFEWSVLDWNKNAIEFYEGLGAIVLSDWRIVRLDRNGISQLAQNDQ